MLLNKEGNAADKSLDCARATVDLSLVLNVSHGTEMSFLRCHFVLEKPIILPRQARDKHQQS